MTESTNSFVSGEIMSIENTVDLKKTRKECSSKLKEKVILFGKAPKSKSLLDTIKYCYSD
jgi:hypothetical protein